MNNIQCIIFVCLALVSVIGAICTYNPPPVQPAPPVCYLVTYVGKNRDGVTFTGRSVRYWARITDLGKLIEETEAKLIEDKKAEDCVKIVITSMDKLEKYP